MAKSNKQGGRGPGKKNKKNQKNQSKNQGNKKKTNDDQGNLKSFSPDSFTQQGTIRGQNAVEKLKKQETSSITLIMKNYNDVFGLSILQIIGTLYSGLEPTQILEFIDFQHQRFLEILLLMLEDELPRVNSDISMINDSNSFINQEIPRSFSFGMRKLREKRKIDSPNNPIDFDEIDVKCIYVSYLLLIGVGEISPKMKSKEKGETTEHHFHRIVTHLLKRNELLTPKLFYLLEKKWNKIMDIVYKQIEQDEKERSAQRFEEQKRYNENISTYINEPSRSQHMQTEEKRQKKTDIKQFVNEPHNLIEHQDSQMMGLVYEDYSFNLKDLTSNDPDESKHFQNQKLKDYQTEKQRNQRVFRNVERELQQTDGKAQQLEEEIEKGNDKKFRMKQQCDDYQAIQKAKIQYNYKKFFTVERNSRSKKIQKQSKKKLKNDQEKKPITKSDQKIKQQEISEENVSNNQQIGILNVYEDDFYMEDEEIDLYGREGRYCGNDSMEEIRDQEQEQESMQRMPSETIQSSERVNMMSEFQNMQLQSGNVRQASTHQIQPQNVPNPNRAVRHQHRQIDSLVGMVLSNREQFIEIVANHIYFQLVVWNDRIRLQKPQQKGE